MEPKRMEACLIFDTSDSAAPDTDTDSRKRDRHCEGSWGQAGDGGGVEGVGYLKGGSG